MNKKLSCEAYAKINLYLDVVGKRPNGYHDIESIMQQISLCDIVTITRGETENSTEITITCTDKNIPCDKRNIAHKCASAFFVKFGIEKYSITIDIEKNIPAAAGLAGGSTDGAAVLLLLNELYNINATLEELCKLGASVGADIPFCLIGGTCVVRGIGEILEPIILPPPSYSILLVFPGDGVSTVEAYSRIDTVEGIFPSHSLESVITPLLNAKIPLELYNAFEHVILPTHKMAAHVHKTLYENGASAVLMSGSGPSIFGLFTNNDVCRQAYEILSNQHGISVYICNPIAKKQNNV